MQIADEFQGWRVLKHFTAQTYDGLVIVDQWDGQICTIWFNHPFDLTDEQIRTNILLKERIACLIAASPELFRGCRAALAFLNHPSASVELGERALELLNHAVTKVEKSV
jgi:hypothetical protein